MVPHGCSEQIVRIIIPSVCVCVHPAGQNVNRITRLQVEVHPHTRSYHTCPAFDVDLPRGVVPVCVSGAHLVLAEGEFSPSPRALRSSCSKLDQISSSN